MIIIPHHPPSNNFFIENPTKKFVIFFGITYMHSNYTTSIYPFNLGVGSMFIFGGSTNGKSSKINLIVYSHQQFNLLGFSLNLASKIWLFWIFEVFENFNLNFELREATPLVLTIHVLCQPLKISFQTCKYQIKKTHLETLV